MPKAILQNKKISWLLLQQEVIYQLNWISVKVWYIFSKDFIMSLSSLSIESFLQCSDLLLHVC